MFKKLPFLMDDAPIDAGAGAEPVAPLPDAGAGELTPEPVAAIEPTEPKQLTAEQMQDGLLGAIKKSIDKDAPEPVAKVDDKAAKPADAAKATKTQEDQRAALLTKKPDDFKLTPAESAAMTPKSNARFQELVSYGKAQFERAETIAAEAAQIAKGRDDMMAAFREYQVTPDDLVPLLQLNKAVKTGNYQQALQFVNAKRAELMTAMGIEGEGVDLLAPHADLRAAVENLEMSRQAAIEVANARRTQAAVIQHAQRQTMAQNQQQQIVTARQNAAAAVSQWANQMSTSDPQYSKKEQIIVNKINDITSKYPPNLWVSAIQDVYAAIQVQEPTRFIGRDPQPLRPNGAGGGREAPKSMLEALKQRLQPQ